MRWAPFLFCLLLIANPGYAGSSSHDSLKNMTTEEYIIRYSPIAIKHMKEYGIPASITLAQGILESASGNSDLAMNANNHFGIKCHKDWGGDTYHKDDDEKNECFRKYKNPEASFTDHALFLSTRSRYATLFELSLTDYKGWAHGLKAAGYATNPTYAERLINLIEKYELYQYDSGTKKKKRLFNRHQKRPHVNPGKDETAQATGQGPREIKINNGVKYIVVQPGDQIQTLSQLLDIRPWMLRKYNDLPKDTAVNAGDIIYLQSKKRKGAVQDHIVKEGETLHSISQLYGIRLSDLCAKNNLETDDTLIPGTRLKLRKK